MTSKEWKDVKLKDITILISRGITPKYTDSEGVIVINQKCIRNGQINLKESRLTDDKTKKISENKFVDNNDILICSTGIGTLGRVGFLRNKLNTKLTVDSHVSIVRANKDYTNPIFLGYNLFSRQSEIEAMAKGSTGQTELSRIDLGEMNISLPPLETQEKIARVLSSLDDKIELNNKINQNLEQQADLLFNDLFLEDKNFIKLSEVISTTSGGTPSRKNLNFYTNGSFCWVKSKELNGTFITETEEKINQLAIEKSSAKLLPPYSVLLAMYGATVGEYAIISKQMTCNQAICAIIPNEKYPYTYIYEYIKLSKEKIKTLAIGSAQQNISQVLIKDLLVHKNINKIKEYHFKTKHLFELIKNNQIENEKLKQLRDTLLPKLMSGEIDVDKVEV